MNPQVKTIYDELKRRREYNYKGCKEIEGYNKCFRVMEDDAILSFIDDLPFNYYHKDIDKAADACVEMMGKGNKDVWSTEDIKFAFKHGVFWNSRKKTLEDSVREFLGVLSETPYNNTPITEAQSAVKSLLTFLEDPKSYDPNKR